MQLKRTRKTRPPEPSELEGMQLELNRLRSKLYAAKIAYLNRTPFQGRDVSYEDLREIAQEYIRKSYAYQRVQFGKLRVRMSVAKLLR